MRIVSRLLAAITQMCYPHDVTLTHTYLHHYIHWVSTRSDCCQTVDHKGDVGLTYSHNENQQLRPYPQPPQCTDLDRDYEKSGHNRGHNVDALDNAPAIEGEIVI